MTVPSTSPEIESLVSIARTLPPELVRKGNDFAEFLGSKRNTKWIDVSGE